MRFFKNEAGGLYVDPIIANHAGLTEIAEDEFSTLVAAGDALTEKEKLAALTAGLAQALSAMTHDLGGGRVIQVRPEDEANFTRAYRLFAMTGAEEINWKMSDNTFHPVTEAELREAQDAGIMQGAALWVSYEADSGQLTV